MRARRLAALLLVLATGLSLTGCWDHAELEGVGFILALGVDPAPGNQVVVTSLVAVPGKLAGGKEGTGGGDQPHTTTVVQAPDIVSALNLAQAFLGRRASLLHCKVLVVGEALARQGLAAPINELARFRQARRTMNLIVARGTAMDLLQALKPDIERDPTRYLEIMTLNDRYTGFLPDNAQLHDFATVLSASGLDPVAYLAQLRKDAEGTRPGSHKQGGGNKQSPDQTKAPPPAPTGRPGAALPVPVPQFLPGQVPRRGTATIDMIGTAVFRQDRLVGVLSGEETRLMLMLKGRYYRSHFSLRDPIQAGQWVTLDLRRARPPTARVSRQGNAVTVSTQLELEAELVSQSGVTNFTLPANRARLEAALGQDLATQARAVQRKAQRWQADVFGYGERARRLFATWDEWLAFGWRRRWTQARLDTSARVQIRRYGMQTMPLVPS